MTRQNVTRQNVAEPDKEYTTLRSPSFSNLKKNIKYLKAFFLHLKFNQIMRDRVTLALVLILIKAWII